MKHSSIVHLTKKQESFFSAPLAPISFVDWLTLLSDEIQGGCRQLLFSHHNLHSLFLVQKNTQVEKFYSRSDHCYIDGMPVRWLLVLLGIRSVNAPRFSLMDEFSSLLRYATEKKWVVFYLGSSNDVARRAQLRCNREFPELNIQFCDGYQSSDAVLVDRINTLAPDLLLVGMGMPRQEVWLLEYIDQLDVGVATHAGGTLDYYVGEQAKPPRWMSDAGFAWVYRLVHNPRRLWRRYLFEPCMLLWPLIKLWWAGR